MASTTSDQPACLIELSRLFSRLPSCGATLSRACREQRVGRPGAGQPDPAVREVEVAVDGELGDQGAGDADGR